MTTPDYNAPPPGSPYPPNPGQQQFAPGQPGQQYGPGQPGQQQYGMPPGTPPGGQYGGMPPAPPQKSLKNRRIVALVIFLVVAVIAVIFGLRAAKSSPDAAKIGDCVSRGSAQDIKVVACTDANVAYKVVGKVPDKTQVEFSLNTESICKPFTGAKSAFWKGKVGEKGYVLCLAPVG